MGNAFLVNATVFQNQTLKDKKMDALIKQLKKAQMNNQHDTIAHMRAKLEEQHQIIEEQGKRLAKAELAEIEKDETVEAIRQVLADLIQDEPATVTLEGNICEEVDYHPYNSDYAFHVKNKRREVTLTIEHAEIDVLGLGTVINLLRYFGEEELANILCEANEAKGYQPFEQWK